MNSELGQSSPSSTSEQARHRVFRGKSLSLLSLLFVLWGQWLPELGWQVAWFDFLQKLTPRQVFKYK